MNENRLHFLGSEQGKSVFIINYANGNSNTFYVNSSGEVLGADTLKVLPYIKEHPVCGGITLKICSYYGLAFRGHDFSRYEKALGPDEVERMVVWLDEDILDLKATTEALQSRLRSDLLSR